jgi:hypothetical protein
LQGQVGRGPLCQTAALLLGHKIERLPACEPPHLLEPLDGHQSRQGLTFPLDDELVSAERYPVEHVADSLPHVDRGNLL